LKASLVFLRGAMGSFSRGLWVLSQGFAGSDALPPYALALELRPSHAAGSSARAGTIDP
jgi:hypothetical protein